MSGVPPPLPPRPLSHPAGASLSSLRVDEGPTTDPPNNPTAFEEPSIAELEDPNYREFDYEHEDVDADDYLTHASFGHVGVTDGSTSLSGQSAPGLDGTAIKTAVKRTWGETIASALHITRETIRGLFGLSAADPDELTDAYARHLELIAEEDRESAELARRVAEQSHLLDADACTEPDDGLHRRHGGGGGRPRGDGEDDAGLGLGLEPLGVSIAASFATRPEHEEPASPTGHSLHSSTSTSPRLHHRGSSTAVGFLPGTTSVNIATAFAATNAHALAHSHAANANKAP